MSVGVLNPSVLVLHHAYGESKVSICMSCFMLLAGSVRMLLDIHILMRADGIQEGLITCHFPDQHESSFHILWH
jgi:hypothetical protein